MKEVIVLVLYFLNGLTYLLSIGMWIAAPNAKTFNISVSLFSICLSILIYFLSKSTNKKLNQISVKRFALIGVNFFLVLSIFAFINYLSFKNSIQLDFSKNKKNSLTEDTNIILDSVESKVDVSIIATKSMANQILALAELYRLRNNNFKINIIDPDVHPEVIKTQKISQIPAIKFENEDRSHISYEHSEIAYTNSILRITRKSDPVIYYTIDHGELSLDETSGEGASSLKELVKNSLFDLRPVALSTLTRISQDISALVILGPQTSFSDKELEVLDSYLANGGNLLLALDPAIVQDKFKPLRLLLQKYEIVVESNLVIDKASHVSGSNGSVPLVTQFDKKHPITKGFDSAVFFPLVSSVTRIESVNEIGIFTPLLQTSSFPDSWADKNPAEISNGKVIYHEGVDIKGPIPVAAAWEEVLTAKKDRNAKIVVFGNSSFVRNSFSQTGGNYRLFLRSLNWLADDGLIRSFNLPVRIKTPFMITSFQRTLIFYSSIVAAPLALFGIGFIIYRRRKSL